MKMNWEDVDQIMDHLDDVKDAFEQVCLMKKGDEELQRNVARIFHNTPDVLSKAKAMHLFKIHCNLKGVEPSEDIAYEVVKNIDKNPSVWQNTVDRLAEEAVVKGRRL